MFRYHGLLLVALLLLFTLSCRAQEEPPASFSISGECLSALKPLAAWMGATVTWAAKKTSVKVALGTRALTLEPYSVVAKNAQSRPCLLPVSPVWRDGQLFVPVHAVADALGVTCTPLEEGRGDLRLMLRDRNLTLPIPPVAELPLDPAIRLPLLIADLRLPVDRLATSKGISSQIRPYLEGFVRVAKPVQPALTGIANSKALRLLSHVPVVGGLVSVCQDAIGTIAGTIGVARRLVEMDAEYLAPIRDGFAAARDVATTPDAAMVAAARPKWTAALAAAEKQRALNETAGAHVHGLLSTLNIIEAKMAEFRKAYPQSEHVLSLGPLLRATQDLQVTVGAHHWQMTTMQGYFLALLDATAPVEGPEALTENVVK
ncbi:MAG: hypothetical protein BWY76_02721 [bacterium ADurb.Bin429]|nr:MAG: hypothetical protein BWY76_02721 [bacterium ADurb.Bin429]